MHKIFFTLLTLIFAATLFAQSSPQNNQSAKRRKLIRKVEREIDESVVLESLRKCNEKIKKSIKDNKPLLPVEYSSCAASIDVWLKYRWLIADTGLSKKWLKKIYDQLIYIGKMKRFVKVTRADGKNNITKIRQAKGYINISHQRFFELMKKTVRVSKQFRQKEQEKKDIWQKAMRKKYNIKKNSWYSVF